MRWADLDLLGHVNNVVYVDYLQEARVDMFRMHSPDSRADDLAEGVVVVRHEVGYRAPLTFRFRPVQIETWVSEIRAASFTLCYEIFDEDEAGERTVYLRATSVLTPYVFADERPRRLTPGEREVLGRFLEPEPARPRSPWVPVPDSEDGHYPVQVRFSDVDVYRHVNNVRYFEYLQESRIRFASNLGRGLDVEASSLQMVVAQTDVDYLVPITLRPEPYDVYSRVSRVGRTSYTIDSEIRDGATVLSRASVVCVFFDPQTQRATEPPPEYVERLRSALA